MEDKPIRSVSLEEMKKLSYVRDITLSYHFSESPTKRYRGIELASLLKAVYGWDGLEDDIHTEAVLEAIDGYQSYGTVETLLSKGGYIAFQDLDTKDGWEPVGRERASPAPYFLIWERPDQNTANGYPWPWQLKRIRLVTFARRFPRVFPHGKAENSPEYRGYLTFKSLCFRCHAIDRQGGTIGPDLAAPKHILEYRTEAFVRQFIKRPESFRYSKMPPHEHLSATQMDSLIAYLKSRMGKRN